MAKVRLKNTVGVTKTAPVGFSWTTFFFGGWVQLFRGNWGEVLKWFFLNPITLGIWGLVQCWTTNKKNIIMHIERGYEPETVEDRNLLIKKSIITG